MKLLRYKTEFFTLLKIIVPVSGIIFFNWSIGTIFLYFWFDLLFIGGETVLKIFSAAQSTFGNRLGTFFRFILIFTVLLFFMMIVAGMSFDGAGKGNMEARFEPEVIYGLVIVYLLEYFIGFIFSGDYKKYTSAQVEIKTYGLVALIFFLLVGMTLLLRFVVPADTKNYVLGISLVVARQLAEYFLLKNKK